MRPERIISAYHITHLNNLASIQRSGMLLSDGAMRARDGHPETIGMNHIKQRRLAMPVRCHPGTYVGEYVPCYFCPRSVMLYLLFRGNSPDLTYAGGQDPIVHLEFSFDDVVTWAETQGRPWAISSSNAGAMYTRFYKDRANLDNLDWEAIAARDWRPHDTKEHKQAELLVYESIPWRLVRRIGVHDETIRSEVMRMLGDTGRPLVEALPEWYY